MSESQQDPADVDGSRRSYVSPPVATGPDRVTDLLFHFETRGFSPLRRVTTAWWRRHSRRVLAVATASLLFVMGATVANEPGVPGVPGVNPSLARELEQVRGQLHARQGELELARLELQRLSSIVEHSKRHRIPADLAVAIYDIATTERVDPALAFSLVRAESDFTRLAVSSAGAVGFTQVMPSTAFWLQPGLSYRDLFERDTNLRLGFRYLRMMLEQYDGDLRLALLAYNRGPGVVDDILRAGGDPGNGYARNVRVGILGARGD